MTGYTKLFGSIIASTVWREDNETRIVWITMLAMADQHGIVESSIPGLSDFARVSLPDTERALQKLMDVDKYSRTKEHEGRRIKEADGGWLILNHAKYRASLSKDERREYMRKLMANKRAEAVSKPVSNVSAKLAVLAQAEAKADTKAKAEAGTEKTTTMPGKPGGMELMTQVRVVLGYLNDKTGKHFRETENNLTKIAARFKEGGVDLEGMKQMIDRQCARWLADPKMREYLRPETLFGKEKFDGYYAARTAQVQAASNGAVKPHYEEGF